MASRTTHPKVIAVILLVIAFGVYIYFQTSTFSQGPQLTIETPHQGQTFSSSLITVSGTTQNISRITLNDRDIFVDESGDFSEQLLLPPGYSILEIVVYDRFDRIKRETREVVFTIFSS